MDVPGLRRVFTLMLAWTYENVFIFVPQGSVGMSGVTRWSGRTTRTPHLFKPLQSCRQAMLHGHPSTTSLDMGPDSLQELIQPLRRCVESRKCKYMA